MSSQPSHSPGTLTGGLKAVASTATPEALGTGTYHWVDIQAWTSNTASLTIGPSTVVHGTTTQLGIKVAPGECWTAYDIDLATIYADVEVNAEGVSYTGVKK